MKEIEEIYAGKREIDVVLTDLRQLRRQLKSVKNEKREEWLSECAQEIVYVAAMKRRGYKFLVNGKASNGSE